MLLFTPVWLEHLSYLTSFSCYLLILGKRCCCSVQGWACIENEYRVSFQDSWTCPLFLGVTPEHKKTRLFPYWLCLLQKGGWFSVFDWSSIAVDASTQFVTDFHLLLRCLCCTWCTRVPAYHSALLWLRTTVSEHQPNSTLNTAETVYRKYLTNEITWNQIASSLESYLAVRVTHDWLLNQPIKYTYVYELPINTDISHIENNEWLRRMSNDLTVEILYPCCRENMPTLAHPTHLSGTLYSTIH